MSKFKVSFRDPNSGRQMEVEADQHKADWWGNQAEKSFETGKAGDGKVDLLVESGHYWKSERHLGISTEGMSSEDASALKRALEDPVSADLRVFDLAGGWGLSGLKVLNTDAAGELAGISDNIDTTGSRREVRLTPGGFVARPDGQEPTTLKEQGDGWFRAASMIDDVQGNLFDKVKATAPVKEKMLNNLISSMKSVAPSQALPEGMEPQQGLQLRSSAATTMLELMTSKHNNSPEFKAKAFDAYETAIKNETNPLLKDSMLFNLNRLQGGLPSSLRDRADGLMKDLAPTHPPYEKWFADGDNTVKVAWSAGSESYKDDIHTLQKNGFEVLERGSRETVLEKTVTKNGEETKFHVTLRRFSTDMFAEMADEDVDIQMYTGHSNWGRNVRTSLDRAPDASGDGKLIFTDLCVGKGEIQMVRDKFPDADLVTTYNSSYFRPGENGVEPESEGIRAILNLFDGISERRGYESIANEVRDENPWKWTHDREGIDNNFIFPTDLETRRRVLDQDHDGQADVFDRMVNFNTFAVETDTAREFQAIEPSRPAEDLVGTKVHFAAQAVNRMAVYSGIFEPTNSTGEVVPGGYFTPAEGENSLFRFEQVDSPDGQRTLKMSMNSNYAHMSEEALRMAASYEYSMFKGTADGQLNMSERDSKLNGLVFASHSLDTDAGYRDRQVWGEFLKAYNFPADISRSLVESVKEADDHYYSGSRASIRELWDGLNETQRTAIENGETGVIR